MEFPIGLEGFKTENAGPYRTAGNENAPATRYGPAIFRKSG